MELFEALKIIEARKKAARNLALILLLALSVVFFSSFLIFNGVVIKKAQEIAAENTLLAEENEELNTEIAALRSLIDDGLENRIEELEAALQAAENELAAKDTALIRCNEALIDSSSQLSNCYSELEEEKAGSGRLENDLNICRDSIRNQADQLQAFQRDLTEKDRSLDQCREELKQCAAGRAREQSQNRQNLEDLRRQLADCNGRIAEIEDQCKDRIGALEQNLANCLKSNDQNADCDLEVVLAGYNFTCDSYRKSVNAILDKARNAGQVKVLRISQQEPPKYIKQIKINGDVILEFF